MSDAPEPTIDTMASWMTAICQLIAENRRLRDRIMAMEHIPVRHCDRPPGFIEMRRSFCNTPDLCFEFSESAMVCGRCDAAAIKLLLSRRQPAEGSGQ